jgi:3-oxoacyl-ACP reductase-like protein
MRTMSSQESSEEESILSKNIIVVGSMEDAKKLLGDKDKYVTKEQHKKTLDEIKMTDAIKDMSSREDDFLMRMSTELTLFKSEKAKSAERIRNSKNIYEEQAKKACNPSKRQTPSSDSSASKRARK